MEEGVEWSGMLVERVEWRGVLVVEVMCVLEIWGVVEV